MSIAVSSDIFYEQLGITESEFEKFQKLYEETYGPHQNQKQTQAYLPFCDEVAIKLSRVFDGYGNAPVDYTLCALVAHLMSQVEIGPFSAADNREEPFYFLFGLTRAKYHDLKALYHDELSGQKVNVQPLQLPFYDWEIAKLKRIFLAFGEPHHQEVCSVIAYLMSLRYQRSKQLEAA